MHLKTTMATSAVLLAAVALTACSGGYGGGSRYDHFETEYPEYQEPQEEARDYEGEAQEAYEQGLAESQAQSGWSCYYEESLNDDWHDDVVCSNGIESHRPYLLEWVDYITYDDIMGAAAEYETSLNSQ